MKVQLIGTGVAIGRKDRVQSGILLKAGENRILFDCGSGVLHRIAEAGIDATSIESIFLTHLHLDHVSDVLPLIKSNWLSGEIGIDIFGPPGTEGMFSLLLDAFPYLREKTEIDIHVVEPGMVITFDSVRISCFATVHGDRVTCGYCAEEEGKKVAYTGDTEASSSIIEHCTGADILIHECAFLDGNEIPGHTTPTQLGEVLAGSTVHKVVLTHFYPETAGKEEEMAAVIKRSFPGEVIIGRDLLCFDV